ncbi:MAG TPA: HEAT repeat domain-containing protein, partial [Anaeromyxobacter sp.]
SILAAALVALAACGNPKDAEGWARRAASRSRLDEKLAALAEVRKAPGDRKAAVPPLVDILKDADAHPKAKGEAAVALGEIGDPGAAPALVAAIRPDARDRDAMDANRHAADALGALRAREAVPVLKDLLAKSPDGYTQVAAVDALGRIGDPAAVDTLVSVATGDKVEPFTARKALLALGRIGDARATAAVLRMLFEERPGVSFFPEASFAAVQIGRPMAAPLLAVLEGRDAALGAWAKEHGILPGALYAKSAQLLGDVGGAEAVPALVRKLSYQDVDPGIATFVRVFAAESLGRMRAKEAVRPLAELVVKERDPDVRDRYCDALARIGDPAALGPLRTAAQAGEWSLRQGPFTAMSRLGGEAERPLVVAAKAKDCAAKCAPGVEAAYAGMVARLDAAKACSEVGCWAGKLGDSSAPVRDRAALEVGRAGGAAHAAALGEAIVRPVNGDADLVARYHAVLALGWIASREKLGPSAEPLARKIEAMIAQDRGRTLTAGVNEDALRLAIRLGRAGPGAN